MFSLLRTNIMLILVMIQLTEMGVVASVRPLAIQKAACNSLGYCFISPGRKKHSFFYEHIQHWTFKVKRSLAVPNIPVALEKNI